MPEKAGISEQELIQKCKKADLKYQELLYKRFYGYAMGVGLRYLSDREDVLETVNDSFIKVFKSISSFNDEMPFKAWLRKIVVNTSIDRRRKNLRQVSLTDMEAAEFSAISYNHTSELFAKDILNLLHSLPEMQRMIFNLYEIDGYSHEEVGNILGIPASSSRVYLARAKEKLKKMVLTQDLYDGTV